MEREQIRAGRGLLNWSQDELAERAGVKRRVVAAYESGARVPHQRNLDSLSAALCEAGVEEVRRDDGAIGVVIRADALMMARLSGSPPERAPSEERKS